MVLLIGNSCLIEDEDVDREVAGDAFGKGHFSATSILGIQAPGEPIMVEYI